MELQEDVMEHILKLARTVRRYPINAHGITHGGYRVTNAVMKDEGIRTYDLAKALDIRPASITESLKKLEKDGFIYRKRDEKDSRIYHIYTTEKAREEHLHWVEDRKQWLKLNEMLTKEEVQTFCGICDKICAHFEGLYEGSKDGETQKAYKRSRYMQAKSGEKTDRAEDIG